MGNTKIILSGHLRGSAFVGFLLTFDHKKNVRKSLFYVGKMAAKSPFSGQKAIQYIGELEIMVAFLGFKSIQDIVEP